MFLSIHLFIFLLIGIKNISLQKKNTAAVEHSYKGQISKQVLSLVCSLQFAQPQQSIVSNCYILHLWKLKLLIIHSFCLIINSAWKQVADILGEIKSQKIDHILLTVGQCSHMLFILVHFAKAFIQSNSWVKRKKGKGKKSFRASDCVRADSDTN